MKVYKKTGSSCHDTSLMLFVLDWKDIVEHHMYAYTHVLLCTPAHMERVGTLYTFTVVTTVQTRLNTEVSLTTKPSFLSIRHTNNETEVCNSLVGIGFQSVLEFRKMLKHAEAYMTQQEKPTRTLIHVNGRQRSCSFALETQQKQHIFTALIHIMYTRDRLRA